MNNISFCSYTSCQPNNKFKNNCVKKDVNEINTKNPQSESEKNIFKKMFAPLTLAGLMCISSLTGCGENKVFDRENVDGTKIEYFNVSKETRDSVAVPLLSLKSKLDKDDDFLKDVDVNITGKYENLDDSHSFKTFLKNDEDTEKEKGTSFYSDNNIKRIIVVQEDAHNNFGDKFLAKTSGGNFSSLPVMRHSLMHEVGHQFDEYYGHNHDDGFAKKWDEILEKQEKDVSSNPYSFDLTNEENIAYIDYNNNSGLSDSKDFKLAMMKDIKHIMALAKNDSNKLPCNISYYTDGIDLNKNNLTIEDIEDADFARAETYANLFSYAVGENDGDKNDFVNAFSNSYHIVRRDILEKLGAKALGR